MSKRVYGFEQYKQLVKEGSYKPGFITEYEEGTSIDDLNNDAAPAEDADMPSEDEIPEGDASVATEDATDDTAVADDSAATDEAPVEEVPTDDTAVADDSTGTTSDTQKKLELVSGVLGKYNKFSTDGGQLDDGTTGKIDAIFKILNDSAE